MNPSEFAQKVKNLILGAGFDKVGIAPAGATGEDEHLGTWLENGCHASMNWMARNVEKRLDPTLLVPGAKSILAVAMNYFTPDRPDDHEPVGRISRYAWGDDYHRVLKSRLKEVLQTIRSWDNRIEGRCFVDTAPIMDKFWAVKAGLGWIGKHSNVITREFGSWVFLGEIVLNVELPPDLPQRELCGTCRRCIDACPTGAIIAPYVVDARKCIAYWTIEHRGEIDRDIAVKMGNRIFGCDACQDVCPWNQKFSRISDKTEFSLRPGFDRRPLRDLSDLTEYQYYQLVKNSPLKRPGRAGFMRNVMIARRNSSNPNRG